MVDFCKKFLRAFSEEAILRRLTLGNLFHRGARKLQFFYKNIFEYTGLFDEGEPIFELNDDLLFTVHRTHGTNILIGEPNESDNVNLANGETVTAISQFVDQASYTYTGCSHQGYPIFWLARRTIYRN